MLLKRIIKKVLTKFFSWYSFINIKHGTNCKCNFYCKFTSSTSIGNNCHFNGITISGQGKVIIKNNFHSGKRIRILTSYHNFDHGKFLPYDNTYNDREVIIDDNVWVGEDVIILGRVHIGEGAVIQAGSVVCQDIPPLAIAGGHPAKAFKYRNNEHYINLKVKKLFM